MSKEHEISEEVFDEVFEPIQNHLDPNAGWNGTLFETFGEEFEFVSKVSKENPRRIWTLIVGDEGMVISAGMHWVNRLGYFITMKDWSSVEQYVPQDMDV